MTRWSFPQALPTIPATTTTAAALAGCRPAGPVAAGPAPAGPAAAGPLAAEPVALVDLLDRVLARGVVVAGEVTLSIAEVDLVHVSLRALISSVRPDLFGDPAGRAPAGTGQAAWSQAARSQGTRRQEAR